jgi:hypothetical protein
MSALNKVSELQPPAELCSKLKLVFEIGTRDLSLLWYSGKGPEVYGLHQSYSSKVLMPEEISGELKQLMQLNASFGAKAASTQVFINTPESVLIPVDFYEKETAIAGLDLVYGESFDSAYLIDELKDLGLVVISRFPVKLKEELENCYPGVTIRHVHAALISRENTRLDLLACSVHPDYLLVMLVSGQQLKFFKQIDYRSPEDASYHLLNICRQFSVSPEHIKLRLDGLLDKDSQLFKELHKYFGNLVIANDPMVDLSHAEALKTLPAHYYFKLIRLAACAS